MNANTSPIIILGMHRSGTSCLAGSLEASGLFLGKVSNENRFNKKGNKENDLIMKLNDSILKFSGGTWNHPPTAIRWSKEHETQALEYYKNNIEKNNINTWGFKDPRTLITLDFWINLYPEATFVGTIRNPHDVAISLNNRNPNYSYNEGIELWYQYNKRLLNFANTKNFTIISFDEQKEIYLKNVKIFIEKLTELNPKGEVFFENKLRKKSSPIGLPNKIEACYNSLKQLLA